MPRNSGSRTGMRRVSCDEFIGLIEFVYRDFYGNGEEAQAKLAELLHSSTLEGTCAAPLKDLCTRLAQKVQAPKRYKKERAGCLRRLLRAAQHAAGGDLRVAPPRDVKGFRSRCLFILRALTSSARETATHHRLPFPALKLERASGFLYLVYDDETPNTTEPGPNDLIDEPHDAGLMSAVALTLHWKGPRGEAFDHCADGFSDLLASAEVPNILQQRFNRFAWIIRAASRSEILRHLDMVLWRILHPALPIPGPPDPQGRLTIAVHVLALDQPFLSQDPTTNLDVVCRIADRSFSPYATRFDPPPDEESRQGDNRLEVLVTGEVEHLLRHRYSFEPIGEIESKSAGGDPISEIVCRAWSRTFLRHPNEKTDAIRGPANAQGRVIKYSVTSDIQGQWHSHALIHTLEEDEPNAIILHWQCALHRKTDLLSTVVESLRHHVRLNRKSHFVDASKEVTFDPQTTIEDWLDQHLSKGPNAQQSRKCLMTLLLGSPHDRDYAGIVDHLLDVLGRLARPVWIVVENLHHADELVEQVIERVDSVPDESKLELFTVGTDQDGIPVTNIPVPANSRLDSEDDLREVLEIAAVLGWDFPLSWLRRCWLRLEDGRDIAKFRSLFQRACVRGILQYCGMLTDHRDKRSRYREVKWSRVEDFQQFCAELDDAKTRQIVREFSRALSELHFGSSTDPLEIFSSIRCKARVFRILQSRPQEIVQPPCFMALGWLHLAKRARSGAGTGEAVSRLRWAREWAEKIEDQRIAALGELRLQIAADSLAIFGPCLQQTDASEALRYAVDVERETRRASHERPKELRWALERAVWACTTWHGNLRDAEERARKLLNLAREDRRTDLEFEAYHALSVTQFGLGDLKACLDSALAGLASRTVPDSNEPGLFGRHDGRVCCRIFKALPLLLMDSTAASSAIKDAIDFASSDIQMLVIAHAYAAMFEVL